MKAAILAEWPLISKLLDEAVDLPVAERAAWLSRLPAAHQHLKPYLEELINTSERSDTALPDWPQYTGRSVNTESPKCDDFTVDQIVGPYRLLHLLGEGGMGSVWLAQSVTSAVKLSVALKLPQLGTQVSASYLRERFDRERAILATLNHPNIARLYEAGVAPSGQPYLALEYVRGETLIAHCNSKHLSINERLALFVQVLHALQYAHSNLIIHRDLKPSNILVTEAGEVKLLDFGIAKLLDTESLQTHETELTQLGGRAMTLDYASPEQIRGKALTTGSDVYSCGVLLHELLTGKRPYKLKRGTRAELEEAILNAEVSRPSTVVSGGNAASSLGTTGGLRRKLSGDLDTIVLKALKKNTRDRYPSVAALQDDVQRHLSGRPVLAQPDSAGYRLRKFLLRNRLPVSAAAAVIVALVAGLAVALWQAREAREKSRIAEQETTRANAVKTFLTSLFERNTRLQANAASVRSKNVRDVLLEASEKIEDAFANDPITRAELTRTIGTLLIDVDEFERASKLLKESVAIGVQHNLSLSDAHIDSLSALVNAYRILGRGPEAVSARDTALQLLDARGDKTSLLRARVLANTLQHLATNVKREETLLDEAITLFEGRYANHSAYFTALVAAGQLRRTQGHWSSAIPYFEKASSVFSTTGSRDYPNYAASYVWRGFCDAQLGRTREGLNNIRRGLDISAQHMGETSRETRFYGTLYARILHRAGERAAAHVEFAKLRVPDSEPKTANGFTAAVYEAQAFVAEGLPQKAIATLIPYADRLVEFGKGFYPNGVAWASTLAVANGMQGDFKAADAALARIAEIPAQYSLDAKRLGSYKHDVAWLRLAQGRYDEAVSVLTHERFYGDEELDRFSEVFVQANLRMAEVELRRAVQRPAEASQLRTSALVRSERAVRNLEKFVAKDAMPYISAHAYYVVGMALKANGRHGEGNAQITNSIALMRELHDAKSIWRLQAEQALAE